MNSRPFKVRLKSSSELAAELLKRIDASRAPREVRFDHELSDIDTVTIAAELYGRHRFSALPREIEVAEDDDQNGRDAERLNSFSASPELPPEEPA